MSGPVGNPEDRFSRVNNVKIYVKSRFSHDAKLSLTASKALDNRSKTVLMFFCVCLDSDSAFFVSATLCTMSRKHF